MQKNSPNIFVKKKQQQICWETKFNKADSSQEDIFSNFFNKTKL